MIVILWLFYNLYYGYSYGVQYFFSSDNWWNERLQEEKVDEENTTAGEEDDGEAADDGQDYEPGPDDPDFVVRQSSLL